jgi:hypothetical protein
MLHLRVGLWPRMGSPPKPCEVDLWKGISLMRWCFANGIKGIELRHSLFKGAATRFLRRAHPGPEGVYLVIPAKAGIQWLFWIPGRVPLARNDDSHSRNIFGDIPHSGCNSTII